MKLTGVPFACNCSAVPGQADTFPEPEKKLSKKERKARKWYVAAGHAVFAVDRARSQSHVSK